MTTTERSLIVPSEPGQPGQCTRCGKKFREPDMLRKFKEHKCSREDSQAAAKIARETTKD